MKKLVIFVVLAILGMATTQAQKKTIFFKDALNSINMIEFGENNYFVIKGDLSKIPGTKKEKWEAIINSPNKVRVDKDSIVHSPYSLIDSVYSNTYKIWYEPESQLMKDILVNTKFMKKKLNGNNFVAYIMLIIIAIILSYYFFSNKIRRMLSIFVFCNITFLLYWFVNKYTIFPILLYIIFYILGLILFYIYSMTRKKWKKQN